MRVSKRGGKKQRVHILHVVKYRWYFQYPGEKPQEHKGSMENEGKKRPRWHTDVYDKRV